MNRSATFNSPFLLGFEHLERLLERTAKSSGDGYPPYNIEQHGPDRLRITLAVAGFAPEDLSVTIEDKQLVIRGKQADGEARDFLHRGIAARQFQRSFVLADGIEVTGAELEHGLLAIELTRPETESVIRKIAIRSKVSGDQ
jgi:HSP20 family molecular chaperone IbpA